MWFGSTAMGASNYGKVGYSHQKRLQKSIFQRIIIFIRYPGDGHHISIGIKNVECLNIAD